MNIRQELLSLIEQLNDEQLSALLDLALSFKNGEKSVNPAVESQAYQDWVSPENDIYDEVFADELTAR
ncbi:MAG: hypothetical protein V7K90_29050 [Nostoc sp.]|jgi:hypothetical protein|uniref:hypothetical protein n=1 Tax=unclassified Nostoc TaxID=2593658 RepID=UPI00083D4BC8|nr:MULTISPECIES: hypothetical protein [unclassified Nostoc]MBN3879259.1 hypothetical protein [Nostoc sp. JL23]MDZ8032766.1 hypothetical protein [Nostoc sp. DedSLP04]ODH00893.1 hypothetical protein A4S05_03655 [Nostoc sp. KVJ20]